MQLDTINKLFLELSQVATAQTAKEKELRQLLHTIREKCYELCLKIEELDASEKQTECSIAASDLNQFLREWT